MSGSERVRIAVAADHNGLALKAELSAWLRGGGYDVHDLGAYGDDPDTVVDYPPLCWALCREVTAGRSARGIVLGGSGLGETVVCNKVPGIRAGLCHDVWSAGVSRGNNDANVLVLAARTLPPARALEVAGTWLTTPFRGGVHARRLAQIAAVERGEPPTGG
ncbi:MULTISPECIES: RpiB/LacA/LacB family sugar-phosphate isomerase [unclassified Streptomyces]|uniref:RpiB/LacA/LacB family sugar-phosphate isomerase n=1 Tax=unclassified Streptomyces TaxID=2593676 RepID=UPI00081F70CB|nr:MULTISPECIES: RpiB/LacA/LacB family sugar-phosphate isomerase [unclassified Streptomyces]SCD42104.1 ribose 5-phosphate isomerase B [Streptomyces sp. TverLS-915]SCE92972.1 ribose 5-phosphate isomerase B [Streptomyces sp. LcepLS]